MAAVAEGKVSINKASKPKRSKPDQPGIHTEPGKSKLATIRRFIRDISVADFDESSWREGVAAIRKSIEELRNTEESIRNAYTKDADLLTKDMFTGTS